jgi:Tol biopolymer transport system component
MQLTPGTKLGSCEVVGPLGVGGMGEVYRARDTRLGREVALKVLPDSLSTDRERLARFQREAQVLASFNHPNVASIYGVEDAGGTPALVLELVEGPTLADRIARGPMPLAEAIPIARQVAEALEYAHERGVVHRDLKPANVKLDAEGRAKVLDFGLAKALAPDPTTTQGDPSYSPTITSLGTMAGAVLGTAAYMSPEQARGSAVDRRADIWAFGALLWEMLSGRRAFEGETVSDTLASVLRAPLEWDALPPATPRKIRRLLERCLERDPKRRLRDIGEARITLESPDDEPGAARGGTETQVAPGRGRVGTVLPWALFAGSVIGLVAVLLTGRETSAPEPITRFLIPAPATVDAMNWPRFSPDGGTLAFLGRDASNKTSIWLRPLDSFEAFPLAGTEDAGRPFWSPDGRHLAFFRSGQLLKVPVGGGPAQLICEAPTGADGSWGSAGIILFDGAANDPLRRCPAAGGIATEQARADAEKGETQHAWPFFLPDGRHYLFLVIGAGGKQTIHLASLDEPGSKPLVPTDSRAEFGSGYLLYILQETLVAQRLDESSLAVVGDPLPLASGVSPRPRGDFSVSANGALAYRASGEAGTSRLIWVDRSGKELGTIGTPDEYLDLDLSPDGSRLAYGLSDGRQQDLWVRDLRRDVTMRLTSEDTNEVWPVWSPDGTRIAYSSDEGGSFALTWRSASGTGKAETLHGVEGSNLGALDWSRDGRSLLFAVFAPGRRPDVRVLSMAGERAPIDFLDSERAVEMNARFSPDGKWVAYQSDESGRNEIYVQPYPATGAKWTISNGGGTMPAWRGDGRELFYRAPDDSIAAVPMALGMTLDAGNPATLFSRPLQPGGIFRNRYVVSADGQRFLLNVASEKQGVTPFSAVLRWTEGL